MYVYHKDTISYGFKKFILAATFYISIKLFNKAGDR